MENKEVVQERMVCQDGRKEVEAAMKGKTEETVATGEGRNSERLVQVSHRFKLTEILKSLHSHEFVIYSEASRTFISMLRGDSGGNILCEYVHLSPKCAELLEAWRIHLGKQGMFSILSLVSVILSHPHGNSQTSPVRSNLDNMARFIIENKLDDIYSEINSQDSRRQISALSLLASIVRRRLSLASELAKRFDFKLPVLSKLSGILRKKVGKDFKPVNALTTRQAFVGFAMSFLDVGNPRLLKWILQQKDMYSGVLRGLANDDIDTVVIVLSNLRDRVLSKDSAVPPALRSVLFGSATLEQLSFIAGTPSAGPAADIAHDVLITVCTDPQNGLMPCPGLKGNRKRLLDLMMKLKPTEADNHKKLLLAIAKEDANLHSAYLDDIPYLLEPRSSSSWFSAISFASDFVSITNVAEAIATISNSEDLHGLLKCVVPKAFNRMMMNKGLLHSNDLVKHGSLRLLLESLKLLNSLITSLDAMIEGTTEKDETGSNLSGLNSLLIEEACLNFEKMTYFEKIKKQDRAALKLCVQNEIRAELPDPQVLLKLLSSTGGKCSRIGVKRTANYTDTGSKKLKLNKVSDNIDLFICGLDATNDTSEYLVEEIVESSEICLEVDNDNFMIVCGIWGLNGKEGFDDKLKDTDNLFQSKLLDALKYYLRAMPIAFERSFDFFKILPANPLNLNVDQQRSILSLLAEYVRQSSARALYKHLHSLLNFFVFSRMKDIKSQAYVLVRAALISTGAFDQNLSEIDAWLAFLPSFITSEICTDKKKESEALCEQFMIIISFFCEAVSMIGTNLYKHFDQIRKLLYGVDAKGHSMCFSPLIICVLQKCLKLLEFASEKIKLFDKCMISLYVGNTLSLIMQSQVDMRTLPSLIHVLLNKVFEGNSADGNPKDLLCEWIPLKNLLDFSRNILADTTFILNSLSGPLEKSESLFSLVITNVEKLLECSQGGWVDELAIAFSSSIICAAPNDILANFPSVLAIMQLNFPSYLPLLSSIFFQQPKLLASTIEICCEMLFSGFEMSNRYDCNCGEDFWSVFSSNMTLSATDYKEVAPYGSFMKCSSFYTILSAFLSFTFRDPNLTDIQKIVPLNRVLELLQIKISEGSIYDSILYLKFLLFWIYHLFLLGKEKQIQNNGEHFLTCVNLVQDLLVQIYTCILNQAHISSVGQDVQTIVKLISSHPIVAFYILNPLYFSRDFNQENVGNILGSMDTDLNQFIHSMDQYMFLLLGKLFNFMSDLINAFGPFKIHNSSIELIMRTRNMLLQKILETFRERFNKLLACKSAEPFLPVFGLFQAMVGHISLFDLLKLTHWMFCKIEGNVSTSFKFAASVCLFTAGQSLDKLRSFLQPLVSQLKSDLFIVEGNKSFDPCFVPNIFYKILHFSLCFHLEQSDLHLLKAMNIVYNYRCTKSSITYLPLHSLLSSMIFSIPVKMLVNCIYSASKMKTKMLFLLTEISPIHMDLFGQIFMSILNNNQSCVDDLNAGAILPCISKDCFLSDHMLTLLPIALSYFIYSIKKYGKQGVQRFRKIPLSYTRILWEEFSNWNALVSRDLFQQDYDDFSPINLEEFYEICGCSYIGKAVIMLHYSFVLNSSSIIMKKRLKLFECVCPQLTMFEGLSSCVSENLGGYSYKESLKVTSEAAAKMSLMKVLLFSSECSQSMNFLEKQCEKDKLSKKTSERLNHAKLRFLNILINTLDHIFKQFPHKIGNSSSGCSSFRLLEHLILKEIAWLSKEMHSYIIETSFFSYGNRIIRSSLLHRFEDPVTLRAIRCILALFSGSEFPFNNVLEILIGHSAFAKIILQNIAISESSAFTSVGALLQPINTVLKLIDVSGSSHDVQKKLSYHDFSLDAADCHFLEAAKLELVKLVRILFHLQIKNSTKACFNSKELLSLLLCGYNATQSATDLELFSLMKEIESLEGENKARIEAFDYIWGAAAMKMRKEKIHDVLLPSNMKSNCETNEEQKIRFRDSIFVDSKICAATALHLCKDRSSRVAESIESLIKDISISFSKITESLGKDTIQLYDPSFILRFSIHCLSMGYLEPMEFARLGLLAITFASISLSDEEVRKLGYECLGIFKVCLGKLQKDKDSLQILLLLTYLQNGITEEWQEIPSVFSIFTAEASLALLEHPQNHFFTISNFLMHLPKATLKTIPLFHTIFGSASMNFRKDRIWVLRLLYAGMNTQDDAKLYLRNKVFDSLLSYSSSSLGDNEFKILTLMIIKKGIRLHLLADYLVKEFGLLPWLSSLLTFYEKQLIGRQVEGSFVNVVKLILEVVNVAITSNTICEWLQDCALEQLSEFSLLLLKLFVDVVNKVKDDVSLINAMLVVITSTVRLSQKRSVHQPHLILSLECLFQLFHAVSVEYGNYLQTAELGLYAVLINTPTPLISLENKEILNKLLALAVPAALWSYNKNKNPTDYFNLASTLKAEGGQVVEPLASKILRWVSASVILGSVLSSHKEGHEYACASGNENLLSYLKRIPVDVSQVTKYSSVNESLSGLILHLLDFASRKCVLPSVVSALCVLLISNASYRTRIVKKDSDDNYDEIQLLCSKIRFPVEANPDWRWSFDYPWSVPSVKISEMEEMEEEHACRSLLIIFLNGVSAVKSQGFPTLSVEDVKNCGFFEWEKETIFGSKDV